MQLVSAGRATTDRQRSSAGLRSAVLCAGLAVATATAASAADICVVCDAPSATYTCQISDTDRVADYQGGAQAIEYLCLTEVAKAGGHGKCRTKRSASACDGKPYTVSLKEAAQALAARHLGQPTGAEAQPAHSSGVAAPPSGPQTALGSAPASPPEAPRTVKEMAEKSFKSSGESIKSAGDSIGTGIKNTWTCMTSLFQRCGP